MPGSGPVYRFLIKGETVLCWAAFPLAIVILILMSPYMLAKTHI